MSYNEFHDDVLLTLDANPDSVLRRVKTFDKGVVLQIAVPHPSRVGSQSPWDGVKIIYPFDEAWIDQLIHTHFLVEQTVGGEQVYVLVRNPPKAPELPEPPSPNAPTGVAQTSTGDMIVPFKQDEGIATALNALIPIPNADDLAKGDGAADEGESDAPAKDGEIEPETPADLGEPKAVGEEPQPPKPAEPPPAKPSGETKPGKPKNK